MPFSTLHPQGHAPSSACTRTSPRCCVGGPGHPRAGASGLASRPSNRGRADALSTRRMNPSLHKPVAIEVERSPGQEHLHNLRLQYRPGGHWQSFVGVYIPQELRSLVTAGLLALHLETLQTNGYPQHSLPGRPEYLLIGVVAADGSRHAHVPSEYVAARARRRMLGAALMAAGALALLFGLAGALAGAGLLVWGTHEWRTSREFDCTPFRVNSTYS